MGTGYTNHDEALVFIDRDILIIQIVVVVHHGLVVTHQEAEVQSQQLVVRWHLTGWLWRSATGIDG